MEDLIARINFPAVFLAMFVVFAIIVIIAQTLYELYLLKQYNFVEPTSRFGSRGRGWKLFLAMCFESSLPAMGVGLRWLIIAMRFMLIALVACGVAALFYGSR